MNLLPWLLDWPPGPATIVAFLLVTGISVGTLMLFGDPTDDRADETVTVESVDLAVRLNDEHDYPDAGDGTVRTCLGAGTPGDHIGVSGDVTIDVPDARGRNAPGERGPLVEASLAHTAETTTATVEGTGRRTVDVFWILRDDETLSVGESATLQVRVRVAGETLVDATRTVTVEEGSRSYECDPSLSGPLPARPTSRSV